MSIPDKPMVYDVPLRDNFIVQIVVPRNLTVEEARRMGAFLLTLAADVPTKTLDAIIGDTPYAARTLPIGE